MNVIRIRRLICFSIQLCCICNLSGQNSEPSFHWKQDSNHLALFKNEIILWQLNFSKDQDKPYFHPLRTPQGFEITLERPEDHPWHRGLWFSFKDINGTNYWEEDVKKGVSAGRSIIKDVKTTLNKDFSAEIIIRLSYQDSVGKILEEKRTLYVSSPVKNSGYTIVWQQNFTALKKARLYLEKPAKHGGVKWGGYAGLSYRGSLSLQNPTFLASNGWKWSQDTIGFGEKVKWMEVHGQVKGRENAYAGITLFDHPKNPRYPSPWYIWYASGKNLFFCTTFLFDEPMILEKGEKMNLLYKTFIHDGQVPPETLTKMFNLFSKRNK